ncbi:hypothetical protein A3L12_03000 [Thermococcus sp. P6]|nr:hypothetical protein A3L12_03000 [Thermococcus sp. P6]
MKAKTIIYWIISALKPFRRNKIPVEKKIRAIILARPQLQASRKNTGNQPHNTERFKNSQKRRLVQDC